MDKLRKVTLDVLNSIQNTIDYMKTLVEQRDFKKVEEEINNFDSTWESLVKGFNVGSKHFVIRIPYDVETQTIKYELDGNQFTVKVENDNTVNFRGNCMRSLIDKTTIPSYFNDEMITKKYSPNNKMMYFIFQHQYAEESKNEVVKGDVDALIKSINASFCEPEDNGLPYSCDTKKIETEKTTEQDCNNDDDVNSRIYQLYTEGKSFRYIARQVGLSDKTVARRIKKMIG